MVRVASDPGPWHPFPGDGDDATGFGGWSGTLVAVSHRFPIRGYLARLYGPGPALPLVDALGNGEALELKLEADAAHAPTHHRLTDTR